MKKLILICGVAISAMSQAGASLPATDVPEMVTIPAGSFLMGSDAGGVFADEGPVHRVTISRPFAMSVTEITNAEFERFFPAHRTLRGLDGVSADDNEPVVNVSYQDALAYCRALGIATGRRFRLPTEAEWEYACRAGTSTPYWCGDTLDGSMRRNQVIARDYSPVGLHVDSLKANPFGLKGMHGNVEEWCMDWYGPYASGDATDPAGPRYGLYRVTRGGSHHTPEIYLASSRRMAMIPSDRHSLTGFRIVESDVEPVCSAVSTIAPADAGVSRHRMMWRMDSEPFFAEPIPFVIEPEEGSGTPFYSHNHQPAVTWVDNGDILAIWFTGNAENGREVAVLQSRFHPGADGWTPSRLFFKVPGRNMTGSSLLNDGHGTLYHLNGVEAAGDWQNLALAMRTSVDNGASWSAPRLVEPRHTRRHQVISGPIVLKDGTIVQLCDAGPGSHDGTSIHLSRDRGATWTDPWDGAPLPDFSRDTTGTTIAGIHAGIVELHDGTLMTLGRGNSIKDSEGRNRMPMSLSRDGGATWHYSASEFPPIDGGQRLILRRLMEGPLLLIAFTDHPERTPEKERGMKFRRSDGVEFTGRGMYAALSFDDGRTWPVRKLITDGMTRTLSGGAWTGSFVMDSTHAEPSGYLAATQSPDGTIHLLSSRLHYRFNLPWLLQPAN